MGLEEQRDLCMRACTAGMHTGGMSRARVSGARRWCFRSRCIRPAEGADASLHAARAAEIRGALPCRGVRWVSHWMLGSLDRTRLAAWCASIRLYSRCGAVEPSQHHCPRASPRGVGHGTTAGGHYHRGEEQGRTGEGRKEQKANSEAENTDGWTPRITSAALCQRARKMK